MAIIIPNEDFNAENTRHIAIINQHIKIFQQTIAEIENINRWRYRSVIGTAATFLGWQYPLIRVATGSFIIAIGFFSRDISDLSADKKEQLEDLKTLRTWTKSSILQLNALIQNAEPYDSTQGTSHANTR